jgi:hypothetical protein
VCVYVEGGRGAAAQARADTRADRGMIWQRRRSPLVQVRTTAPVFYHVCTQLYLYILYLTGVRFGVGVGSVKMKSETLKQIIYIVHSGVF